ncbi:hypothetical protein [Entomomonas moraniae]|uniref:hypothetical protein n=1 Tax=Entomomonas moraniae TaxID=2213226 RepID=UPI0013DEE931|nr:hypothetical protein [Entomomonas moraniae]
MKFIEDCFIELFTDPSTYALLLFGLVIFLLGHLGWAIIVAITTLFLGALIEASIKEN